MALPAGLTTCTVTYGKALGPLGGEGAIDATLTMDRKVVHAATGWSINPVVERVAPAGPGQEISFQVPHVDQPGLVDASGAGVTNWKYILTGNIRFQGQTLSFKKEFQVFVGQESIDLDLIPDGSAAPPATTTSIWVKAAQDAADAAELSATSADASADAASGSATAAAGSATAAGTAQTAAETARAGAETAQSAAETAATSAAGSASSASASASTATTKASEASTSADQAASSATAAQTAETHAATAQTAAENARTGAETARTGAETARTGAETARDEAEAAAAAAADHSHTNMAKIGTGSPSATTFLRGDGIWAEIGDGVFAPSNGTVADYLRGDTTWQPLNKAAVGLGNVDNTSDANKPISTATQTALNAKQATVSIATKLFADRPEAYPAGPSLFETSEAAWPESPGTVFTNYSSANRAHQLYFSTGTSKVWVRTGDNAHASGWTPWKQFVFSDELTKANVGLGNVDNTSDVNKPISTAVQTALNGKAAKASPILSGAIQLGTANTDTVKTKAIPLETHTRTTEIVRSGGVITQILEKNGTTTVKTTTINRTNGLISSISSTAGGNTSTSTIVRDGSGNITSITRSVS